MKSISLWIFAVLAIVEAQLSPSVSPQSQQSSLPNLNSAQTPPSSNQPPSQLPPYPQQDMCAHKKNYYFNKVDQSTWFEAKQRCVSLGMRLVVIDTREKYDRILMQLKDADFSNGFWIGGTCIFTNRQFYWAENGQNVNFADWGPGQPDNYGQNEDCLDLRKYSSYKFNDLYCGNRQGFICEYQ